MELSIVKEDDKKLIIETKGETIAFAHLIKDELWKDNNVKEAAAIQEHPYLSQPKIFVITSKGSPKVALEKASDSIVKQAKEFGDKFKAASK